MKKEDHGRSVNSKALATFSFGFDPESAFGSLRTVETDGTPTLNVNVAALVTQAYIANFKESIQKAAEESPTATREELVLALQGAYWKEGLQSICDALAEGDEAQARLVEVVIDAIDIGAAEALEQNVEDILHLQQQIRGRREGYRAAVEVSRDGFLQDIGKVLRENPSFGSIELIDEIHQQIGETIIEAFDVALQQYDFAECELRLAVLEGLLMASTQLGEDTGEDI
jgi:PAS domain-containing protein